MSTRVVPRSRPTASDLPPDQITTGVPTTMSGISIKRVYNAADLAGVDVERDIGAPGGFPFTRGMHHDMYCHRTWTMRQFAGMGSAGKPN